MHQLVILLEAVLGDLDVTLALLALVAIFCLEILHLQVLHLQLSISFHSLRDEFLLLFFKLSLIKGVLGSQLLLILANDRDILLIQLFSNSFDNLLHRHVALTLSLQLELSLRELALINEECLLLRPELSHGIFNQVVIRLDVTLKEIYLFFLLLEEKLMPRFKVTNGLELFE